MPFGQTAREMTDDQAFAAGHAPTSVCVYQSTVGFPVVISDMNASAPSAISSAKCCGDFRFGMVSMNMSAKNHCSRRLASGLHGHIVARKTRRKPRPASTFKSKTEKVRSSLMGPAVSSLSRFRGLPVQQVSRIIDDLLPFEQGQLFAGSHTMQYSGTAACCA
jgi:hypothetical protein